MFEELSDKFEDALKTLRGQNKITEGNISPALRIVRKALLDADVNLQVARDFLEEVKAEALGIDVVRGINPEQKFIDIVHKCLVNVLGSKNEKLEEETQGITVILLVGLQGAGKTTAAAKLGLYLKEKGRKVKLVAADTFRPAAKDQLITLGKQTNIEVYTGEDGDSSIAIAKKGVEEAITDNYQIVIVDTAGRLYIDNELMNEVHKIKEYVKPKETLLVVDSMIGQEAAELTKAFDEQIGITGAILTKLDGDSRGGAALSIKKISGKGIKFVGTGEKVEALEPFYPDRMASRILGMGDILTLVDKAQKEVDISDVVTMQKKFEEASFDFTDFLKQMKLIKRMGSIGGLMKLIPGMNKIDDSVLKQGETQLRRIQSMIDSMTQEERSRPELLMKSPQRRRRIAKGSGYNDTDVDKVISDFERMRGMMQNLAKGNFGQLQEQMVQQGRNASLESDKKLTINANKKKDAKKKRGFFDL
ncbi:MAG: signal recognition particle protein [Cyanobacteriota bacterium]|jgi:signal recognition particle subunit SRP54